MGLHGPQNSLYFGPNIKTVFFDVIQASQPLREDLAERLIADKPQTTIPNQRVKRARRRVKRRSEGQAGDDRTGRIRIKSGQFGGCRGLESDELTSRPFVNVQHTRQDLATCDEVTPETRECLLFDPSLLALRPPCFNRKGEEDTQDDRTCFNKDTRPRDTILGSHGQSCWRSNGSAILLRG